MISRALRSTPRSALAGTIACLAIGVVALPAGGSITGLEVVASGLDSPLFVTHAPGDPDRVFVLEQGGVIHILDVVSGQVLGTPFLTIPDTDSTGEGGLLGLAFHPDYAQNGRFFVYVTVDNNVQNSPFSSHLREYVVSVDPDVAESAPREILEFVQPASNHNAGWIGFNPKLGLSDPQYLYITSGDGGTAQSGNAQLTDNLLGKVLRIDVDGDDFPADPDRNYAIPAGNPFVGQVGADEIWAFGLRNPFRASFDRQTGDLWMGDVGAAAREEIDFLPAASAGGENYAWDRREGSIANNGGLSLPGDVEPMYDYLRGTGEFEGRAVIGGHVYRGPDPDLQGLYFFADQRSGHVWTFDPADPMGSVANIDDLLGAGVLVSPTSLGEDLAGNLYFADYVKGEVLVMTTPEPSNSALSLVAFVLLFGWKRLLDIVRSLSV